MLWCPAVIAVLLALLGAGLYITLRGMLNSEFNTSLATEASILAATVERTPDSRLQLESDAARQRGRSAVGIPQYFQIWTDHGKTLLRAVPLAGHDLKLLRPAMRHPVISTVNLGGRVAGRELALRFRLSDAAPPGQRVGHRQTLHTPALAAAPATYILAVARPTDQLDDALTGLGWSLVVACSLATVISALLIAWLLDRGLRPIATIAEQISCIGSTRLSERVSAHKAPRELLPIVDRLNSLLARVEEDVAREKALTADMAHELRTPLAGLRTAVEVALSRPRPAEQYQHTLRQTLAIGRQMQNLVENLLTLARLDTDSYQSAGQMCRLDLMIEDQLEALADRLRTGNVTLEKGALEAATVFAAPELIALVLRNVLDNAISYVNVCGSIRVLLRPSDAGTLLEVANTGSMVDRSDVTHVFERFWRGDTARSNHGHHSGLGLSIVHNVMRRIGGTALAQSSRGGWFTITLTFPEYRGDGVHGA